MQQHEQQYQSDAASEKVETEIRLQEFRGFISVCLPHEQQHRWSESGVEPHEAVEVYYCRGVCQDIEKRSYPSPHLLWYQGEDDTQEVDIEEQFLPCQTV